MFIGLFGPGNVLTLRAGRAENYKTGPGGRTIDVKEKFPFKKKVAI